MPRDIVNSNIVAELEDALERRAYEAVLAGVRSALSELGAEKKVTPVREGEKREEASQEPVEESAMRVRAVGRGRRSKPAKRALTPTQQEVYDEITSYYNEHGESPTYAELAAALDKSGVATIVHAIEQKGWIHLDTEKYSRKIVPL